MTSRLRSMRNLSGSTKAVAPVNSVSVPATGSSPFIVYLDALYLLSASAPPWASIPFFTTASALSSAAATPAAVTTATSPRNHWRMRKPPVDKRESGNVRRRVSQLYSPAADRDLAAAPLTRVVQRDVQRPGRVRQRPDAD